MENSDALPTSSDGDASPLDRLEAMLSADDAPEQAKEPQNEDKADVPATDEPEKDGVPEQEGETPEYQLSDMARLLGADESALDVDEDGSLMVKTKIDGVEGTAKFSDLLKSYQLQGHVDKQVREAAEIRKSAIEQSQAIQAQLQVQQQIVGKLAEIKAVEQEYQQYQNVNLDALIDADPVQALKVQQRMRALEGRHQALSNEAQQAVQHIQQAQAQQSQASLQNEAQALMRAIPEWSDTKTADSEREAIKTDLKSRGYSDADIRMLSDHKAVLLARDAMLYRAGKVATDTAAKQVRAAPKIIKPGSSQATNRNMTAIQKIKQEVRTTGSRQSIQDYLLATGKV